MNLWRSITLAAVFISPTIGCRPPVRSVPLPAIEFYDARIVVTDASNYRPYADVQNSQGVQFLRLSDKKEISPGTDDYAKIISGWTLIAGPKDILSVETNPSGQRPLIFFTPNAAKKWKFWSAANHMNGEKVAAVINGQVVILLPLKNGVSIGDSIVIEGKIRPDLFSR